MNIYDEAIQTAISVPFLFIFAPFVFAQLALAVGTALQPGLVAFAVLFQAVRFHAMAPFGVLLFIYFWFERFRVPVHQGKHRVIPFLLVGTQVVAPNTIAPITCLIYPKTVTIKLQTFSLFTIAKDLLRTTRS